MEYLQIDELPSLRKPTFIVAFRGWNDAGEAATLAVQHLIDSWSAKPFASIDPEEFFDFTVARPGIRITEEGQRDLKWPSNRYFYHRRDDAEEDVVLFQGTEPHLKWRAFTDMMRDLFQRMDGTRMVTMGALVAATTHTRPAPITGFATEEELRGRMEGLTVTRARYEGPTGIVGVLHDAWRRAELSAASVWVGLPPYLGDASNPMGALALLETLDKLFAFTPDLSKLAEQSHAFEQRVSETLAGNAEMRAYLAELEKRIDSGIAEAGTPDLPPAGELIGDLEAYLRRERRDK
ncbi:MAG: PAC2 family protein [Chloroflexi bacterium]|nr:PAC2 family protein [Chloroflexota bacterium]